jgi:hypothetical protein
VPDLALKGVTLTKGREEDEKSGGKMARDKIKCCRET